MVRFTTKKIDSLTLGEKMKKMREERRLSLGEISKSTKIQVKYLEFIEEGNYLKLPADVYVKGFLRSYSIFMGLDELAIIKQFEREKGIHKNIKKVANEDSPEPIKFSTFVVTPKKIIVSVILLVVVASFTYLYIEVNNFVSKPRLNIIKPLDGSVVTGSSTHVTGIAEKDALVFINDQPVLVSEKGEFSEDVGLKPGLNVINVRAKSKFNKEDEKSVSVNADFQNSNTDQLVSGIQNKDNESNVEKLFTLDVLVNPNPTWISIEADGNLVYSGMLLPDSVQTFNAKEKISVTSGEGSETFIKIDGKDLGRLTNDKGSVNDFLFNAEGRISQGE
jgi:hypothetical protein